MILTGHRFDGKSFDGALFEGASFDGTLFWGSNANQHLTWKVILTCRQFFQENFILMGIEKATLIYNGIYWKIFYVSTCWQQYGQLFWLDIILMGNLWMSGKQVTFESSGHYLDQKNRRHEETAYAVKGKFF